MSAPHKLPEGPASTEVSPCIALAQEVLTMLEMQKAYFRAERGPEKQDLLVASKQIEKRVKTACTALVATLDATIEITLFEEETL